MCLVVSHDMPLCHSITVKEAGTVDRHQEGQDEKGLDWSKGEPDAATKERK